MSLAEPPHATSPPALLVADTDATQSYVFESNKLPEIRGASRQLDDLNRQIGRLVAEAGHQCIYAGGGGLLALVPPEAAPDLAAQIETLYPQVTGTATITAAWRPLPADYHQYRFGDLAAWAGHWLRARKENKPAPPFFEVLPHQARCQSCQKRPVDAGLLGKYPDGWQLCAICQGKRAVQQREAWFGRFETALKTNPEWLRAYFATTTTDPVDPQSISEIGAAAQGRPGYVGFIYLDGDGIGRRLQSIDTPAAYGEFSQKLRQTTTQAVYAALARNLQPTLVEADEFRGARGGQVLIHPFEILAIGGDDLLLMVPAHVALPIALEIGQAFGQTMSAGMAEPVSMSAGVVLADNRTPIRVLRDLAGQLLKEAKKLAGGGLDFHVLKSVDMLDNTVEKTRQVYPYLLAEKGLRLLGRPYTYPQMQTLWDGLKRLKAAGLAPSQMHQLADALLDGRAAATLFFQYQKARDRSGAYPILGSLLSEVQRTAAADPLPWQAVQARQYAFQTALWDLAELYDFIP